MSKASFTGDALDHPVGGGRGAVLRSDKMEVARVFYSAGAGTDLHSHPEEQTVFVESGRLEVTLGDETYEVQPGQASFHGPDVHHRIRALEDTWIVSFKNIVAPSYDATGRLD